jgi:excisionase family DNA binding protein
LDYKKRISKSVVRETFRDEKIMNFEQKWMNVKELAKYLKCSESTIYHKVSAKEIPYSKKNGLRFYVPAIDEWMLEEQDYFDPTRVDLWKAKKQKMVY